MCGIVAYKGPDKCLPFLYEGLKRLEYRGYDSAGVAYIQNNHLISYKQAGSVDDLKQEYLNFGVPAYIGIGHTRWATHGPPCSRNAHPHSTMNNRLSIVHNGIIENYQSLKIELSAKGYMFRSDTDTEVLLYLIYDHIIMSGCNTFDAVKLALKQVVGAYAIVVMDIKNPSELIIARKGSPLVVGIGKKDQEFFVGSDCIAVAGYSNDIVYLEDGTIGKIDQKLSLYDIESDTYTPIHVERMEHQLVDIELGDYESFMLKEIYEQPASVSRCLAGRIDGYKIKFGGLLGYEGRISKAKHITIIACGSSWHAGLMGKYYIEELCGIKVNVEYASEFKYRKPAIETGDIVIGISQSGETADTIGAIEMAKKKGAFCIGICNSVNSSLSRLTNCGIFIKAGTEIGVASTKAFTNQVIVLLMFALWVEQNKYMNMDYRQSIIQEMYALPRKIEQTLALKDKIFAIAKKLYKSKNCLYLGRGHNFPIALEGALKLKEISYIHAEGYPAAEMKHGPIALVDSQMPVIVLANNRSQQNKIYTNISEIRARSGRVVALIKEGESSQEHDYVIYLPDIIDSLSPIISSIALQLLAYRIAQLKGCNVDKPRNLAKSVTVE